MAILGYRMKVDNGSEIIETFEEFDTQYDHLYKEQCLSDIDKLIQEDEKKLLSWSGYVLCNRKENIYDYHKAFFVLTDRCIYVARYGFYDKLIRFSEMAFCSGIQVFRGDGFDIPEFAIDFYSASTIYFLYDNDDIDTFEAEFRKRLKKYGHEDDKLVADADK